MRYHLVNFDMHPDAVPVDDYPLVRFLMADPALREYGIIQCYNWIHGLTPQPVTGLSWVYSMIKASPTTYNITLLMSETNAWFRGKPMRVLAFDGLDAHTLQDKRIIISIDLDFFYGSLDPTGDLDKVLQFIAALPNVCCITIAISRPYLPDDAFAWRMLQAVFIGLFELPGVASIQFEPYLKYPLDLSRRALEFRDKGLPVPVFDITSSPRSFREYLIANQGRIVVEEHSREWQEFLANTRAP